MEKIMKNDIRYIRGAAIYKEMQYDFMSIKSNIVNFPKSIKSCKENAEIYYKVGDLIVKEIKNDMPCLKKTLSINKRTR